MPQGDVTKTPRVPKVPKVRETSCLKVCMSGTSVSKVTPPVHNHETKIAPQDHRNEIKKIHQCATTSTHQLRSARPRTKRLDQETEDNEHELVRRQGPSRTTRVLKQHRQGIPNCRSQSEFIWNNRDSPILYSAHSKRKREIIASPTGGAVNSACGW